MQCRAARTLFLLIVFVWAMRGRAEAQRTINVPSDAPSVQSAINQANKGDIVNLLPGTYHEVIDFKGKDIIVQGSGTDAIIDGGGSGAVVRFHSGETRAAVLQNLTIRNGAALSAPDAGGIFISSASPTIQNLFITQNVGCGIAIFQGAPVIKSNVISGVSLGMYSPGCYRNAIVEPFGGAILLYGASPDGGSALIEDNTIQDNQVVYGSAGINVLSAGRPQIQGNTIRHNLTNEFGGGISILGDTAPLIIQNLITANIINPILLTPAYQDVGAGISVALTGGTFSMIPTWIVNNTIVGNELMRVSGANAKGTQVFATEQMQRIRFSNNIIVGSGQQSAIDCIQSDPRNPVGIPSFDHNDVFNFNNPGSPVYTTACQDQTNMSGNLSVDPLFRTDGTDPHPYQLSGSSPLIDMGNNLAPDLPSLDFLGAPRLQNATGLAEAIIDLGVYEYPGVPAPPLAMPDFTLTATPSTLSVPAGGIGMVSVSVTPTAANLGAVTFSCGGLPAGATCSFTPTQATFTTVAPQSAMATISLAPETSTLFIPSSHRGRTISLCGLFLPFFLSQWRRRARTQRRWLSQCTRGLSLLAFCFGLWGCGTDVSLVTVPPPSSYRLSIRAAAVNLGTEKDATVLLSVTHAAEIVK